MSARKARESLYPDLEASRDRYPMKAIALFLIIGGVVLALFGLSAMSAASSDVSHFADGAAPDHTVWIMLAGVVVFATGLAALFAAFRSRG